jgi:Fe-S oxidoreductase/FAD/FMN-containing dehydrogenase
MANINTEAKETLIKQFGDQEYVNFEMAERIIYSHDMGSLPQIVDNMIDTLPSAVVRARNKEDLEFLVALSEKYHLPLTPRGNASSGYGDSMPLKNAISVDMMAMRKIVSIDKTSMTVEVEPGIVFLHLQEALEKEGLSLQAYPSSAPGATVGGWVAEGGSGIGSYKYGSCREQLDEIELLLPNGEYKTLHGSDLELAYGAAGTTGFMVSIKLKIMPKKELLPLLIHFEKPSDLSALLSNISTEEFNIYHVQCFLGESILRKKQAIEKSKGVPCPITTPKEVWEALDWNTQNIHDSGAYVLMCIEGNTISEDLMQRIKNHQGSPQNQSLANYLWSERYYIMREKRLGPSLIPSEAILPVEALHKVCKEAQEQIQHLSLEGSMSGKNEVVLLGFVLHDERTFAFSVDYVKSLVLMDIIEKYGGRLYQVGIFFTDKADKIKGKEKMDRLRIFKKEIDPQDLMNPGKLFPSNAVPKLVKIAMKAASSGKSLAQLMSNLMSKQAGLSKKLAADLVYEAFACAQCGYCKTVCSEYLGKGWESAAPRGKFYYLREFIRGKVAFDPYLVHAFLLCTTCKRCNHVCQVNIPIQEKWDDMRGVLIHQKGFATYPAFEMMGGSYACSKNIWTGRGNERDQWLPKDVKINTEQSLNYWAGCTASYVEKDIALHSAAILKEAGQDFNYLGNDEACCGIPFLMAGKWDLFEAIFRYNMKQFQDKKVKQIVTSCPGCWVALSHYYKDWAEKLKIPYDLQIFHITQLTAKWVEEGKLTLSPQNEKITYHDPCHVGRHGGIYEEPRKVLHAIAGDNFVEMEHNRDNALCCGSVLTRVGAPKVSDKIACARLDEALDSGAKKVITNCPCCEFQFRVSADRLNKDLQIEDFSTYVARSLGIHQELNTEPYVLYMWSVFERAIDIMTPQGMQSMMKSMFPEMIEAMPALFKKVIHGVLASKPEKRKLMASMMRTMLPGMMPKLLPGMMPKLMPVMIEKMQELIPDMPESMKEMMPQMMPEVMKRVMKGLLPLSAKGIAKDFESYLLEA